VPEINETEARDGETVQCPHCERLVLCDECERAFHIDCLRQETPEQKRELRVNPEACDFVCRWCKMKKRNEESEIHSKVSDACVQGLIPMTDTQTASSFQYKFITLTVVGVDRTQRVSKRTFFRLSKRNSRILVRRKYTYAVSLVPRPQHTDAHYTSSSALQIIQIPPNS
jgi:hypothetical protein